MDVSGDASEVLLLLDLSEEVLVHIVKVGRFTLTDIGHLRATCKRLCDFFDRIRDTVNDYAFGDLSRYRPYGFWDIDLAAKSGHFEVIQLLHEDEVKRGRVTHCTNRSMACALERGDLDAFIFIACNRCEVFWEPHWYDCLRGPFRCLSREQVAALLDGAPSFAASNLWAAVDAAKAAIAVGDGGLLGRLLPSVEARQVPELIADALFCGALDNGVLDVLSTAKARCADCDVKVTDCLFVLAAMDGTDGALDRAVMRAPVAFGSLPFESRESIATRAFLMGNDAALARLRGMVATCAEPCEWGAVEWVVRRLKPTHRALVPLLLRGRFADAEVVAPQLSDWALSRSIWLLQHYGADNALAWMKEKGLLGDYRALLDGYHYAINGLETSLEWLPRAPPLKLTCGVVDFTLAVMDQLRSGTDGASRCSGFGEAIAEAWFARCFREGNLAVLRHLCERVNVFRIFERNKSAYAVQNADAAVAGGHYAMVSYMIDVNWGSATVFESPLVGDVRTLDPVRRPFNLSNALDTAMHNGHYRLARLLETGLVGQRASLRAAVLSRRWRLFRGVLSRKPTGSELQRAFLVAAQNGRLDFVRWFGENYPKIVDMARPHLKAALSAVRDMRFLRAVLETHPGVVSASDRGPPCEAVQVNYDTFVLERELGVELVSRPLHARLWAERKDALQAAKDFGVRVEPMSVSALAQLEASGKTAPAIIRWLRDNFAAAECH